jgi:hypothetical protein
MPCRSSSFESRCRDRIRSPRTSSRARTRSLAASCSTLGTRTGTNWSIRSRFAGCRASRASVLTRSPGGRCSFDGATTTHRIPAAVNCRANPKPVGGLVGHRDRRRQLRHHSVTPRNVGHTRRRETSPVTVSNPHPTMDRACTSRPTLVRSVNTGASLATVGADGASPVGNPRQLAGEAPAPSTGRGPLIATHIVKSARDGRPLQQPRHKQDVRRPISRHGCLIVIAPRGFQPIRYREVSRSGRLLACRLTAGRTGPGTARREPNQWPRAQRKASPPDSARRSVRR